MVPLGLTLLGTTVYTSWYICASCGFVETWIEREKDLDTIRKETRFLRP